MERQRYTHRRPLHAGADPKAVIRYYRTYRRCHGESLAEFVAHCGKLWDEAHRYGVKPYEGIVGLTDLFPEEWRGWITATAQLYTSSQPPTYVPVGDMPGFLSAVSAGCFHFGNGPHQTHRRPGVRGSAACHRWPSFGVRTGFLRRDSRLELPHARGAKWQGGALPTRVMSPSLWRVARETGGMMRTRRRRIQRTMRLVRRTPVERTPRRIQKRIRRSA